MIHGATGIILAGGKSRRMGQDKSFLDVSGKSLIENAIDILSPVCKKLLIVTNTPPLYKKFGIKTYTDIIKEAGPLAGIYTGLIFSEDEYNVVIACDMPFIKSGLVQYMIENKEGYDAVVAEKWGRPQVLCAVYAKSCIEPMRHELLKNNLKVRDLLKYINVRVISEKEISQFDTDGLTFININTPKEYEKLTDISEHIPKFRDKCELTPHPDTSKRNWVVTGCGVQFAHMIYTPFSRVNHVLIERGRTKDMSYDNSGRVTDYLRISVTDRCNLRCIYCMPSEGIGRKAHDEIITFEEIFRLANIFVSLGVRKIRLTGGEPLVRNGLITLINSLAGIKGVEELCLTTNALLLADYAGRLQNAGLTRINISLDTLNEEKFKEITGRDSLHDVMRGIDKVISLGMPVKMNVVAMRGINEDEIIDFMDFSISKGINLRFIEFMKITPMWREDYFIPIEEVKSICEKKSSLSYLGKIGREPATYYRVERNGIIGFIKTEEANCIHCNRLRLTSTGELKACLYEPQGFSLRALLRNGASDWEIRDVIEERITEKNGVDFRNYKSSKLYMCDIGG